ncbi:MAG: hypothetical protein V4662_00060 [Verrucomicrobiota bacterium]
MKWLCLLCISILMAQPIPAAEAGGKGAVPKKEQKPSGRAKVAALSLTPDQRYRLVEILNEGNESTLRSLPGIGATRAAAIQKGRPYFQVIDLLKAEGVGEQSLVDIVAHAKAGFPLPQKDKAKSGSTKR